MDTSKIIKEMEGISCAISELKEHANSKTFFEKQENILAQTAAMAGRLAAWGEHADAIEILELVLDIASTETDVSLSSLHSFLGQRMTQSWPKKEITR